MSQAHSGEGVWVYSPWYTSLRTLLVRSSLVPIADQMFSFTMQTVKVWTKTAADLLTADYSHHTDSDGQHSL
jgi:hypothetical protein